jgi:F-type H+-transporting ATPase subunit b
MKIPHRRRAFLALAFGLSLFVGGLCAQEPAPPASQNQQPASQSSPTAAHEGEGHNESAGGGPNEGIGQILEMATERAAHQSETWGRPFDLNRDTSYLISLILNFTGIILLFYFLFRAKIPQMFRDRTNFIQKAIRDAQAASAEATEKLKNVEARLAKLDSEVAGFRAEVEKQAAAEEERIRTAAEEDKRRVVESAKMEIDAVARNARRDLKSYAAALAVDIAGKRIKLDERSDNALVREFVDQLGKDGKQ